MIQETSSLAAHADGTHLAFERVGIPPANEGVALMCDYSLQNVRSRPAKVGDRLTTKQFNTGTGGFAAPENAEVAVCLLPGTELSFANEVKSVGLLPFLPKATKHRTAIFRQINLEKRVAHHDALEFPDGTIIPLTLLSRGQHATVLQLPAEATMPVRAEAELSIVYAN